MDTEGKAYWREKAYKWLEQNSNYHDFDLNACLEELEKNQLNRAAALAAFWNVYLNTEDSFILNEVQLDKVRRLMQPLTGGLSKESKEGIQAKAFVTLHLAGIALISKLSPESPPLSEIPSVTEVIKIGRTADSLDAPVDIDISRTWGKECFNRDLFGFSQVLVSGIISVEASRWLSDQGKYEEAFSLMANNCGSLYLTTIEEENIWLENDRPLSIAPEFTPYLPHSGEAFNLREVVGMFEEIKRHPGKVIDWESVAQACGLLQYFGAGEGFYDPWMVVDSSTTCAVEFWASAESFAETQRRIADSPFPVADPEMAKHMEIKARLRSDFFPDTWDEFSEDVNLHGL